MKKKYRVHFIESERGWGQDRWHVDYDTEEEALAQIREVNGSPENNLSYVPDHYIRCAPNVEIVEE